MMEFKQPEICGFDGGLKFSEWKVASSGIGEREMNCEQFNQVLPEICDQIETGGGTPEQMAHLAGCTPCASLWADLHYVREAASELAEAHAPGRDLWPGILSKLEAEGVVRAATVSALGDPARVMAFPAPAGHLEVHLGTHSQSGVPRGMSARWLMPLAATLLLGVGAYWAAATGTMSSANAGNTESATIGGTVGTSAGGNARAQLTEQDRGLLQQVAQSAPEKQAHFQKHLEQVNEYIAAAQRTVQQNPNDAQADETLRDAYSQKAMVYEIAYTETGQ